MWEKRDNQPQPPLSNPELFLIPDDPISDHEYEQDTEYEVLLQQALSNELNPDTIPLALSLVGNLFIPGPSPFGQGLDLYHEANDDLRQALYDLSSPSSSSLSPSPPMFVPTIIRRARLIVSTSFSSLPVESLSPHVQEGAILRDQWLGHGIAQRLRSAILNASHTKRPPRPDAEKQILRQNLLRAYSAMTADENNKPLSPQDDAIKCPSTIEEAINPNHSEHEQWRAALEKEWNRLHAKGCWRYCSTTETADNTGRCKPIKSKYALRKSRLADGSWKYKVRLVACGYGQREGEDYNETFAPTATYQTFCIMMSLLARNDWEARHIDVENAFVEAEIEKEFTIFMNLPTLHRINGEKVKVQLIKSLYGLKQAGHLWFKLLTKSLFGIGCTQLAHDQCMFKHVDPATGITSWVLIYVDDIIFMGPSGTTLDTLVASLGTNFQKITVEDGVKKFTGIEVTRDRVVRTTKLSQPLLINDVFAHSDLPPKHRLMPMNPSYDYHKLGDGSLPTMHQEAGLLRYGADRTQPHTLAHAGLLSRGAHRPSEFYRRGWK